jgi:hypothetical protein
MTIIDTNRWVKDKCRSWDHAGDDGHKMGWLEVGTKLHCVEEAGNWYRFDEPVMPLITAAYKNTWVYKDFVQATPEVPVPPIEPGVITAEKALTFIEVLKYIFG